MANPYREAPVIPMQPPAPPPPRWYESIGIFSAIPIGMLLLPALVPPLALWFAGRWYVGLLAREWRAIRQR